MKRFLTILSISVLPIFGWNSTNAQSLLSPVEFTQPYASSVDMGDIVEFSVIVENVGDSIYVGPLSLMVGTSDGVTEYEQLMYSVYDTINPIVLYPGSFVEINGVDSITTERFLPGDNTIVVWPASDSGTRDSLETSTFLIDPDGVFGPKPSSMRLPIYPNPANELILFSNLDFQKETGVLLLDISIYDLSGKLVMTRTNLNDVIDISLIPSGVYLVKGISNDSSVFVDKLIINR
jgi:hypothetical protein